MTASWIRTRHLWASGGQSQRLFGQSQRLFDQSQRLFGNRKVYLCNRSVYLVNRKVYLCNRNVYLVNCNVYLVNRNVYLVNRNVFFLTSKIGGDSFTSLSSECQLETGLTNTHKTSYGSLVRVDTLASKMVTLVSFSVTLGRKGV